MLRVLIVDDEPVVRHGIIHGVDWGKLDCEVVAEAANGEEGLERVHAFHPDLIITDIRTPRMDGIEMLNRLREEGCQAYAIILTAYSDFNYARSAIKLRVVDYLLKPFRDQDLANAIQRLHKELGSGQTQQPSLLPKTQGAHRYVQEAIQYIAANYTRDLSVTTLAEALAISESRLSHLFHQETAYTLTAYLTRYRIQAAMDRLQSDPHAKVYEVAAQVGYRDVAYFGSVFKKLTGKTPSEYQMAVPAAK